METLVGIVQFMLFGIVVVFSTQVKSHGNKNGTSCQVTAMFVFGDSLSDNGNNNYIASVAKANFYPYGIDFPLGATGRFCNGKTVADYLALFLGLPFVPAYLDPSTKGQKVLGGVNYASAAGGILMQTGRNYALYDLGARKFLVSLVGPLGCIPQQLASANSNGACVQRVNDLTVDFNRGLQGLVNDLNNNLPAAKFLYHSSYDIVMDAINNPASYGFTDVNDGCCGVGRFHGQLTCNILLKPCADRNQYVFWDAFHPTEAVNLILAKTALDGGPSQVYPMSLRQLAQL